MEFDRDKFAKRVEELTSLDGITKTKLAKRAGMSLQRFSNILNGQENAQNMKLSTLTRLARSVGGDPFNLLRK